MLVINVLVINVLRNLTGISKEEGVVTFPEVLDLSSWLADDSPEHHAPGGVVYDCVSMGGACRLNPRRALHRLLQGWIGRR